MLSPVAPCGLLRPTGWRGCPRLRRVAGTALVRAAEAWARSKAAASVQLTTALHRDGAHAFYQRMGFAATGTRFHKPLP